jgi:hypothetical protein
LQGANIQWQSVVTTLQSLEADATRSIQS